MPPPLFTFQNSYANELAGFYAPCHLRPLAKPHWVQVNRELAQDLGLEPAQYDRLQSKEGLAMFAGQLAFDGAQPIAQAYAGHQFGHFSPSLGDGRALLLGEIIDPYGQRQDLGLKGSGVTPFSRGGDGLAAMGPMLREYLISESMHALGVPSTRALGVFGTGEFVRRTEGNLPGAVLIRVASSHLRVGTFEFFAARQQFDRVSQLLRYSLRRHFPHVPVDALSIGESALALLHEVVHAQARLIAQWMGLGFVHGVMNSDNMTISGQTIDYGPCAFMNMHDSATVFSSIDRHGRYAYARQPAMAQWNIARLAESLMPLMRDTPEQWSDEKVQTLASDVVSGFEACYAKEWLSQMRQKLGCGAALDTPNSASASLNIDMQAEHDKVLAEDFLGLLQQHKMDHTLAFRALYDEAAADAKGQYHDLKEVGTNGQFFIQRLINDATLAPSGAWQSWLERWKQRREQGWQSTQFAQSAAHDLTLMRHANPLYIPRNHQVEAALFAASETQDLQAFERLLKVVQHPFDERATDHAYALAPTIEEARGYHTFCGT